MASRTRSNAGRNVSPPPGSDASSARTTRSAPAQNALLPAPVITTVRRSGSLSRSASNCAHRSALSAFLRSGRSIVAIPTRSRTSQRITQLALVDDGDEVALLHHLLGLDVELAHDAGDLGHHGDLHLHGLEDDDLVALGDHLPLLGHHLPHVRRDLGANLSHVLPLVAVASSGSCGD